MGAQAQAGQRGAAGRASGPGRARRRLPWPRWADDGPCWADDSPAAGFAGRQERARVPQGLNPELLSFLSCLETPGGTFSRVRRAGGRHPRSWLATRRGVQGGWELGAGSSWDLGCWGIAKAPRPGPWRSPPLSSCCGLVARPSAANKTSGTCAFQVNSKNFSIDAPRCCPCSLSEMQTDLDILFYVAICLQARARGARSTRGPPPRASAPVVRGCPASGEGASGGFGCRQ